MGGFTFSALPTAVRGVRVESFPDDVARLTSWQAMGQKTTTAKLVESGKDSLHFRFNISFSIRTLALLIAGSGMLLAGDGYFYNISGSLLLALAGLFAVFPQRILLFNGKDKCFQEGEGQTLSKSICFKDIHALQLISDEKNNSRYCELNLVLCNGQRIHLLGAKNQQRLEDEATQVAHFLGTPLWIPVDTLVV